MSELETTATEDTTSPAGARPVVFVLLFALFTASLWLLGVDVTANNGWICGLAMLLSGVAFAIPLHLLKD